LVNQSDPSVITTGDINNGNNVNQALVEGHYG